MSIQIYKFNVSSGNDAAILFNASNEKLHQFMYGCVTNGYDWSFLRLEKQLLQIDTEKFFLKPNFDNFRRISNHN